MTRPRIGGAECETRSRADADGGPGDQASRGRGEASARYGGTELRAAEQARAERRRAVCANCRTASSMVPGCSFRQAVAEHSMR